MSIRLVLFGTPEVEAGGSRHALPFERRSRLLVFLALKRAWVGRAELAAMLWPDLSSKLAYANLRKTLFRLQSLPWAGGIELQGNAIRFEADTDVFDFESALREQRIAQALALWRGELLAGFDDGQTEAWTSWLAFERDRLRVAWRGAVLGRLALDIEPAEGIELSAQLLASDPLDEAALRAHMQWLAHSGQGTRARRAYGEFVERLERDLGLAPPTELQSLHDTLGTTVVRAAKTTPPPASAGDGGFVGRSIELRRIADLMAQENCRLLCLMGPGGIGKTRLARHAQRELEPGFADGAVFVPLEDVAAPGQIGGRIARELGVESGSEPLGSVIDYLRKRQMLLVLDNFEHLAGDVSCVERLLNECPRLKLIVTSRVRLAVAAERVMPLDGLPCPEPEDQDRLEAFDAARLFIQAAQKIEPAFVPAVEAASVVKICRLVEGLPLALELAASWVRVLSCNAIAAELRHGTELLHAVDAARPARHASFEVVFDQSWRLLQPAERDALAKLSVFRGGFTAEAARAVAGASLPLLRALAEKSLLRKDGARLFMHPLVQQLAAARLGNAELRETTEREHARHFHGLLHQLRREIENGDRDALQIVDAEFENCRVAWRWAVVHRGAPALSRSMHGLTHYCDHRTRLEEGLSILRDAIEAEDLSADPALRALLLGKAAHLEYRLDRYDDAIATATRGLEASDPAADADARAQNLKVLGNSHLRLGHYDVGRQFLEESLKLADECSDVRHRAVVLSSLALVQKGLGNYDECRRITIEALEQQRRIGDVAGEGLSLNNLAALLLERQQYEAAGTYVPTAMPAALPWPQRKPWLMSSPGQFRPGPPPAMASDTWARDANEVRVMGSKSSPKRSAEQTEIARFWEYSLPSIYHGVVRSVAQMPGRDVLRNARLLATVAQAMDDAMISVFDAKYHYNFRRPVTAIRNGDLDGHEATPREANWTAMIDIPMHPEYPSAHSILAASVGTILKAEMADAAMPTLATASPTAKGATRRWTSVEQFMQEVSDARVYEGVHYRFSTEVGTAMGRQIGALAVAKCLDGNASAALAAAQTAR